MAAVPVTLTLTFHVDPDAWQMTYGEECTPANVREYFEPLGPEDVLPPAHGEWITDPDQSEVKVKVGKPLP